MIILQKEQKFCPHIKMSKTQSETRLIRQGARIGRSDISPLPHYQLQASGVDGYQRATEVWHAV